MMSEMTGHFTTSAAALLIFTQTLGLGAQEFEFGTVEKPYAIPPTEDKIKVDGQLDEPAWDTAVRLNLNWEIRPRENVPPNVETEVLFTFDGSHLYVAFRCYDPDPSAIRAFYRDRDSLGGDDWVAVELDTYNDQRRAFTLISTPFGIQTDGLSDAAGIKDYSWDTIYESAGKITDWGYTVEMAIPFSSLRFQDTDGPQIWGINCLRGFVRNQRYQIWSAPYDRGNDCRLCQYPKFEGFEGASSGRNIEITPTVTGVLTQIKPDFPGGGYETENREAEVGVTGRWGMTPNLFLGATFNPDFSQVEADALQLDINQPFALFYEERRPFFTDGLDFFQTPMNVIYTRTVRDPRWGIKLTGKEGPHGIGAFVTEDGVTNILIPGSQSSGATTLDGTNFSSVVRYTLDIWNNSNLGAVLTHRQSDSYHNTVYGIDGLIRLGENDTLTAEFLGSSTDYDERTSEDFLQPEGTFSDRAFTIDYLHKTRHWTLEAGIEDVGPDFRADLGFMPQVGYQYVSGRSIYEWRNTSDSSWWTSMRLLNSLYHQESTEGEMQKALTWRPTTEDSRRRYGLDDGEFRTDIPSFEARLKSSSGTPYDGDLLEEGTANSFRYVGPLETSVFLGNILSRRVFNGVEFDLSQFDVSLGMVPSANLSFDIWATFGDHIDFANTRQGDRLRISPSLALNLGTHPEFNLDHTFEQMDVDGNWLYEANISQATIVYNFSSRSFIRAILQYVDYEYNVDMYQDPVDPEYKRLFTQLLYSYKLNARTVLFVGYSDNSYADHTYDLTRSDYTLFVKIGYAFVL